MTENPYITVTSSTKVCYSLNRVMAKLSHTSQTAIAITFLVMNLSTQLSRLFYAFALFFSLLLLSESTAATVRNDGLKIAQQSAPTPSVPLRPEKQQLYQQGVQLVKEAQELEKKGTREGYQQAIAKYQQALKIIQELGLRKEEVEILAYIANVYSSIDDKKNAIDSLKQALEISRQLKQPVWEATALGSIGVLYTNTNNPKEGLTYLQKAQSIFLAYKDYSNLAITLNGIATIYMRVGDTKEALHYRNEALKLYREKLKDLVGEANTLWKIATIYSLSSETRTAINYYEQALKIQQQRKDFPAQVEIMSKIAAIEDKLGNTKKALESLKEALKLQQQTGFNLSDQANTIAYIGHIYAGQANYRTAIDYYQQAGKLFQQAGDTAMESKTFQMIANVFATVQGYYKFYIDLLLQLHKKDPSKVCKFTTKDITIKDKCNAIAFHISERSRARGLLELLTEANAKIRKGANPELLSEERRLQALIDGKEKVRFDIVNSDKIHQPTFKADAEKLQKEIDELLSQQKQLETKIRSSNPKYASLKYPQPLTLPQIQQQLDKDTLLLQYSLGTERSYVWVVSPNSVDTYELTKKQQIEKTAINLLWHD